MHEAWLQLVREGLLLGGAPFLATVVLILLFRPVAPVLGLVDQPAAARKTHTHPTPLVGGAAIALGGMLSAFYLLPATRDVIALGGATLILLAVGTVDDRYDINWRVRIVAQATAAVVLYVWGGVRVESIGNALGFAGHTLGVLSLPFTVLATVGITNSINWADGVDGLAGSLSLAALAMLTAGSIYAGNATLAADLVVMMGCIAAFLVFNLRTPFRRQASVFLGDGAEILGLWIAWAAFKLTQTAGHPVTPVLAPFLIAPPVIDLLVLIVRRMRAGRSPFSADRDHLHHRLLDRGLTPTGVVAVITGASLAVGFIAATARRAHVPEPVFPMIYLAAAAAYFFFFRRPIGPQITAQPRRPAVAALRLPEITRSHGDPIPEPVLVRSARAEPRDH